MALFQRSEVTPRFTTRDCNPLGPPVNLSATNKVCKFVMLAPLLAVDANSYANALRHLLSVRVDGGRLSLAVKHVL